MPAGNGRPAGEVEAEILRAVLAGRVVPVVGLVGSAELSQRLADTFDVPADLTSPLGRVTQYVAAMQGLGPLHEELHTVFGSGHEPGPVHRLLARLPAVLRERDLSYQLIVTTAFDSGVERAFADADEELDVVTYIGAGPSAAGSSTLRRAPSLGWSRSRTRTPIFRSSAGPSSCACAGSPTPPSSRRGRASSSPRTTTSTIPGRASSKGRSLSPSRPGCAAATCSSSATTSADWNLRLVVNRLRGGRPAPYASWAIRAAPTPLELAFWRELDVRAVEVEENAFADLLGGLLDGTTSP